MPGNRGRVFRFGVFEASEATGELRKLGIRIKLRAQSFQVLLMLLERPAEVVPRDEMRQRLWGDGTFVDFDHGLNTAVNKIRDVLDDSAATPRYIETIPGKGYRFIAPVEQVSPEDAPQPPAAGSRTVLTAPAELPVIPARRVRTLLVLVQLMYLSFYLGALANLAEIHDIFIESGLPPSTFMTVLVGTAAVLIPVRLYLLTAVALNFHQLPAKFGMMFPALLVLDLSWAAAPFLLIHHISSGFALGLSIPLVYLPFAQRSLVLMYARKQDAG